MGNPSQNYGASYEIMQSYIPPDTGKYLIYLLRRDGRLSWPCCLPYSEMVYLSTNKQRPLWLVTT